MILLPILLAMQQRVGPPQPVLPPVDPASAVAAFDAVCVRPFPDPAGFAAAVRAAPGFVRWSPNGPLEALVPGEFWQSPDYTVRYSTGTPMAPDLPAPQCQLTASATPQTDAGALFPLLESALRLPAGKRVGHKRYRTAMWDLPRGTTRWRVILGTERMADRLVLKFSMMNLGIAK